MNSPTRSRRRGTWLLLAALAVTAIVYWPGLSGGWLFDDYPNIVENPGIRLTHVNLPSLTRAVLSSPSSEFKRPLSSLTFALNYYYGGLHPFGWKLTNLVIHLLNGVLVFLVARILLRIVARRRPPDPAGRHAKVTVASNPDVRRAGITAALVAGAWMLLPINLTGVLYVVQRMESLANLFVMLGLLGYVTGRLRMLGRTQDKGTAAAKAQSMRRDYRVGLLQCAASLVLATIIGITAKETAVLLPLYAFLIEWIVFGFRAPQAVTGAARHKNASDAEQQRPRRDRWLMALFLLCLALPLVLGLAWLLPGVLKPENWATRDFTLRTRLLSEARIVVGYIAWTLIALPHWLSFYHDEFRASTGLLHPWTTLASMFVLAALVVTVFRLRRRRPLVALGIALFLGCHLLTGTILPLELVYEHRNYFASFGLMLAIVPLLAVPRSAKLAMSRRVVLGAAMLAWTVLTASTAYAWGNSLRLAKDLADRAPDSPRAEYSLGRQYIMASHYDPDSPYTPLVYGPLERAAKLPDSSILPQQALIFFNARMHRPLKSIWWDSMVASLRRRTPGVQDESSLSALTQCAREGLCRLPPDRMKQAFEAAVSHPDTNARLWATYGDYTWNVLGDHDKGLQLTKRAVAADPGEPAYHITLARMYLVRRDMAEAQAQIGALEKLNIGGRLDGSIAALRARVSNARCSDASCAGGSR